MNTHPIWDLVVSARDGSRHEYVVYSKTQSPLGVSVRKSEVAAAVADNPAQSGGTYSVRDQDQPAIVVSDWSLGAGQKSYEVEGSLAGRFHSSSAIDTAQKGELRLAHSGELVEDATSDGILLAALGFLWQAHTPAGEDPRASLKASSDGVTWQAVPYDGADPDDPINCIATDGEYVYVAMSNDGIWRVKDSDADGELADETATQWDDETGIVAMCYSGGYMYGAKANSVGYFTDAPAWNQISPAALAPSLATFGLAPSGTWAYWGVTSGGMTRVSRVQFDGTNEWFEDVAEFPTGFVGTCMASYLGNIYVGGYYECATENVGQGAVYLISGDTTTLLTTIGDNPDYSDDPTATDNDNRVWSLCPHAKDLYILTTRRVLRWDLDESGWVHVMDVPQGTASSLTWLTTGDLDYSGAAAPDAGTWTASGMGTVSNADGMLRIVTTAGNYKTYTAAPSGGDALSNATGTTMQVRIDDLAGDAGEFGFDDGTKECRVRVWQTYMPSHKGDGITSIWRFALGEYVGGAWDYSSRYWTTSTTTEPVVLRLTCAGSVAKLYVDDMLADTKTSLKTTGGSNSVYFGGGWSGGENGGDIKYDYVYIANTGAFTAGSEYAPSAIGTLAVMDNRIYAGINGIGHVRSEDTYAAAGWLRLSTSAAHSGSIEKTYLNIIIDHDPLRSGESISCGWYIDGVYTSGAPNTEGGSRTTFTVNQTGHNIGVVIGLASSTGLTTPIVRGVTVTFSFSRYRLHSYILDCRAGAENRRWNADPEAAIAHLFVVAEEGGIFEDRFSGSYAGSVETCELIQAERSGRGTLEGIVQLAVRELE